MGPCPSWPERLRLPTFLGKSTGLQVVSPEGLAVTITYLDVTAKVPFVYFIYRARNNFLRSGKSESGPALEDTSPSVPAT
jgi:sensory rhodopsin